MKISKRDILIPLDVANNRKDFFAQNYSDATLQSGRLMLFAGDQRVEHLNDDFFGLNISANDADPEHLFKIASMGRIGAFATQFGYIARYGRAYPKINYIVKLNSKTNLVKTELMDPFSELLATVEQVEQLRKESGLKIVGVGYTLYPGSRYESEMLKTAAQIVHKAHQCGLIVVLWIYPRGEAVPDEHDPHLIAGAVNVGVALNADFIKVNCPEKPGVKLNDVIREAVLAAGKSKIIFAGGQSCSEREFLQSLREQLDGGASGNATGRNIHQKSLDQAIKMCNAISAITADDATVDEALKLIS